MAWNCPQCKQNNDNDIKKCTCGYAFYDVLGVKDDATFQSVEQKYRYLIKVWKSQTETQTAGSRSKLDERIKKIDDAYAVFRMIYKETAGGAKEDNTRKIAVAAGIIIALLVIAAGIFFVSTKKEDQQAIVQVSSSTQLAPTANNEPAPVAQSVPKSEQNPQPTEEKISDTPDMNAEKTPDWAIESVKKSRILDRSATVDVLVNKWTKENADKLKFIGWIARKVDDAYLVTYTATDGVTPTGFYFEMNIETGEIRNIAGNAELQRKYGIKGR